MRRQKSCDCFLKRSDTPIRLLRSKEIGMGGGIHPQKERVSEENAAESPSGGKLQLFLRTIEMRILLYVWGYVKKEGRGRREILSHALGDLTWKKQGKRRGPSSPPRKRANSCFERREKRKTKTEGPS